MTAPVPLILDCDPGIDDALALFLALAHPERFELLAITCVNGNRPVDITTDNARALADLAGRPEVPVYRGADRPLDGAPARNNRVHGDDGLGGVVLPRRAVPDMPTAVDALVKELEERPAGSVDLVAVGPLTNLALAEARRPGLLARARRVLVMGGAVTRRGNVTPAAEFNIWADPQAAQQVLQAVPGLWLFGLDVTQHARMSPDWMASLAELPGRCAQASARMVQAYTAYDPLLHDACPIAWLLEPGLFRSEPWVVSVTVDDGPEAGRTSGRRLEGAGHAQATQVVVGVDGPAMLARMRAALERLP